MLPIENYFDVVQESAQFLKSRLKVLPKAIVVLSGGLDPFVSELQNPIRFSSKEIPHFPQAKVEGHKGELVFGLFDRYPVVCLEGRYHYYEGLIPQEVVFPYFVLNALGAKILISTNAVGGIREDLNTGDLMVVEDHVNLMGTNPLIGLSVQRSENQFPSMQGAYDENLIQIVAQIAKQNNISLKKGVFGAVPGPSYETPAEIKAFRKLGVDTVGMSTVFEVIAARFLNMRTLVLNIITNASTDRLQGILSHEEVLRAMQQAQTGVLTLLRGVVRALHQFS